MLSLSLSMFLSLSLSLYVPLSLSLSLYVPLSSLSLRTANCSPVLLDKNFASGVWRKAPGALPYPSSALDSFQSARCTLWEIVGEALGKTEGQGHLFSEMRRGVWCWIFFHRFWGAVFLGRM